MFGSTGTKSSQMHVYVDLDTVYVCKYRPHVHVQTDSANRSAVDTLHERLFFMYEYTSERHQFVMRSLPRCVYENVQIKTMYEYFRLLA